MRNAKCVGISCSYQESSGDENKDTAAFAGRLCVKRGDLVLNLGEG